MTVAKNCEPEFLPRHQAARFLGIGLTTIDKLVRAGQLPAYKFGRRTVLVRREDLLRLATASPIPVAKATVTPINSKPIPVRKGR